MKTTVNGKEIKLFNQKSIEELYTKYVKNYLDVGYNFYFYSGSQGEEVKTCLTKDGGKTVYILYVDCEYRNFSEVKTIWIKKFEDVIPGRSTLWLNKGEEVFKKEFYCINERQYENKIYVETEDDYKLISEVQDERYSNKTFDKYVDLPKSCYKTALKIIQKRKGYKSIQLKDIKLMKRRIGYGYDFTFENWSKNFSIKVVR